VLFIAAHASWPVRDGADRRSWCLFSELRKCGLRIEYIGRNCWLDYSGKIYAYRSGKSSGMRKVTAAARAVLRRRHYLREKFVDGLIYDLVKERIRTHAPTLIIASYLYSLELLDAVDPMRPVFLDTQNDEWEWFDNIQSHTRNPLTKVLCLISKKAAGNYLAALGSNYRLLHVSRADLRAYQQRRPDLTHIVVPNGCEVQPRGSAPDYASKSKKTVVFVGSLSAKMNQDALQYLGDTFWVALAPYAQVRVIGSHPTRNVRRMCRRFGWELLENVDDATLARLYESAHFAVMPFQYGAGSKLKLLEACGRGVPVLATPAALCGIDRVPSAVLVSARPEDWGGFVRDTSASLSLARNESIEFARQYSWGTIAQDLLAHVAEAL
jgi:glycosyltransferase involved in cell wall biosynthesis